MILKSFELSKIKLNNYKFYLFYGDNEGLKEEYEGCKELISKLNVKKIIAMPGNHDYRNTGYLHFKKYFPYL